MLRVAIVLLLCGCGADSSAPAIDEVSPARIDPGVATSVQIHGHNFYGRASIDLGANQPAQEDDSFRVQIGSQSISASDVSRQSSEQLSVQLPPMSEGLYDVVVILPGSERARLDDGLRVGTGTTGADAGLAADAGQDQDGGLIPDASLGMDAGQVLTHLETLTVPTNGNIVLSNTVLQAGVSYELRASGSFDITGTGTIADAEYADFSALPGSLLDTISGVDFGIAIDDSTLDLTRTPRWGAFDISHVYQISFVGSGSQINVNYHDANAGNNSGTLTLEILQYQ